MKRQGDQLQGGSAREESSAIRILGGGYLAAIVCGVLMPVLDSTLVSIGMDTLVEAFSSTAAAMQWVNTAYLLALAVTVPLSGWLLGRLGGRRLWTLSLAGFVVASIGCASSVVSWELIAFRAVQGTFGGVLMTLSQTLPVWEARRKGVSSAADIIATINLPLSLGPILGPSVGGLILSMLSWHWLFLVNVPLGLVGLALALRFMPRAQHEDDTAVESLDVVGVVEVVLGLALVLLSLADVARTDANFLTEVAVPLVLGVVLLALFCRRCLASKGTPLVDIRLLAWPATRVATLGSFFFGVCLYAAQFVLPLWWQQIRGASVGQTGMLLMVQGLGVLVSRAFVGRMISRFGDRAVAVSAFVLQAIMTLPFVLVPDAPMGVLACTLFVRGLASGTVNIPINSAGYVGLPAEEVAHATMLLRVMQQVGSSFGTALVAVILDVVSAATGAAAGTDNAQGFAAAITALIVVGLIGAAVSLRLPRSER